MRRSIIDLKIYSYTPGPDRTRYLVGLSLLDSTMFPVRGTRSKTQAEAKSHLSRIIKSIRSTGLPSAHMMGYMVVMGAWADELSARAGKEEKP